MLMNPHNNPHQPPPGSMAPTQYNQYGQMPNMQQPPQGMQQFSSMEYTPCSPMPPQQMHPAFQQTTQLPGGYPCSPSQPPVNNGMPQQMHPAFHQTPQLPGGYPCSPSRRPPSNHPANMQNVNNWLGNYDSQPYSPAPSVAPSVMSHTSVNLPPACDGSVMSIPSMMHCPTPDLRPPSVLSGMSCSENLDPNMMAMMQNGPHPPVPHPQAPQSIPEQVAVLCDLFDKHQWQPAVYQLHALRKMFSESNKKSDFDCCASLLPRILIALSWREAQGNNQVMEVLCRSFLNFTNELKGKVALQHFPPQQQPQNSQVFQNLVQAAVSPKLSKYFVIFLDAILSRESSKQERMILQNRQFISSLVVMLSPPNIGETWHTYQYLLSIASVLASSDHDTNDQAMEALMQQRIIAILFHGNGLHKTCVNTLSRPKDDKTVDYVLRTLRQMIGLLRKMVQRRDKKKSIAVLSEIASCGGIHAITEIMFYFRNQLRERDWVEEHIAIILFMYEQAKKHQQLNHIISELPFAETLVVNILFILRRSPLLYLNDADLLKREIDVDVRCLIKLVAFLSHLNDCNRAAKDCLADNFKEVIFTLAEFNVWFTRWKPFRSDAFGAGKEFQKSFRRQANDMIDYQDALLYIGNKALRESSQRVNLDHQTIKLLLEVAIRILEVDNVSDWANNTIREIVRRVCFTMRIVIEKTPELVSNDLILTTVGTRKENILSTSFNVINNILEYFRTARNRIDEKEEKDLIQTVARVFSQLGVIYNEAVCSKSPSHITQKLKENTIVLITNNYTPIIAEWLVIFKEYCDRSAQLTPLNQLLGLCEVVSKDAQVAKVWATWNYEQFSMMTFFDSLSSSQDAIQSSSAQHVAEELRKQMPNTSDLTSDYMHMMTAYSSS